MTARKTAGKTAVSPLNGAVIPLGAHAGNTGGKKGRSGRPPNWLRDFCDDLLADPRTKAQVRAILHDKDHPAYAQMWRTVSERAHGKPTQGFEISGPDGSPIPHTWKFGDKEIHF